ncbi:MAG: tRNA (adenosine(37)-N6)-threonylcarbamoyltransferase complex dimerization subunit type 1 TsaB [bacterium]
MKLVAIETATELCGVALTDGPALVAEYRLNMKNMHNEKLVQVIQMLTGAANWQLEEIDGLGVSIGPGSFTGLRIGLAVAKGLAFALSRPIAAVNTLDALASGVTPWQGSICAVIKARENEVYAAFYDGAGGGKRVSDYAIVALDDVGGSLFEGGTLVVANPPSLLERITSEKMVAVPYPSSLAMPLQIAQLAVAKIRTGETEAADTLEPFYLKTFDPGKKRDDVDRRA